MEERYVKQFFSGRPNTTVLVVDDEDNNRLIFSSFLQEMGFTQVLQATNGQEALDLYMERPSSILLVLSDYKMPIMKGDELFWRLKRVNDTLRMILCSGSHPGQPLDSLMESGLRGFLPKPFGKKELGKAVADALM